MKLIDVEYTFDNSKVVFYFTADGRVDFRELVKEISMLMGYEATRKLPLEEVEITTPMQKTTVNMLKG